MIDKLKKRKIVGQGVLIFFLESDIIPQNTLYLAFQIDSDFL